MPRREKEHVGPNLADCPFCGRIPELIEVYGERNGQHAYAIKLRCKLTCQLLAHRDSKVIYRSPSKSQTVRWWNRRYPYRSSPKAWHDYAIT